MDIDTNAIIADRCAKLGISPETARLIGRESGYSGAAAVFWAIGLDPATSQPLSPRKWLLMAAKTSSVSFQSEVPVETLVAILSSGEVPSAFIAHLRHLLEEAPAQILVMAAEQAALQARRPMVVIWRNICNLGKNTGCVRPDTWKLSGDALGLAQVQGKVCS